MAVMLCVVSDQLTLFSLWCFYCGFGNWFYNCKFFFLLSSFFGQFNKQKLTINTIKSAFDLIFMVTFTGRCGRMKSINDKTNKG